VDGDPLSFCAQSLPRFGTTPAMTAERKSKDAASKTL
jgi:hypothetical protein